MMNFKRFISAALAVAMLGAMSTSAFAGMDISSLGTEKETEIPNIIVRAPMYVEKTIYKSYNKGENIPDQIYYEEYDSGVWWKGTLHLQSTRRVGNEINYYFEAKFTGTLHANS
ncbi:MAG: hypothetical protein RR048_01880 [Oscillospiraceae bacterium]